jgi:hypothetical protein
MAVADTAVGMVVGMAGDTAVACIMRAGMPAACIVVAACMCRVAGTGFVAWLTDGGSGVAAGTVMV